MHCSVLLATATSAMNCAVRWQTLKVVCIASVRVMEENAHNWTLKTLVKWIEIFRHRTLASWKASCRSLWKCCYCSCLSVIFYLSLPFGIHCSSDYCVLFSVRCHSACLFWSFYTSANSVWRCSIVSVGCETFLLKSNQVCRAGH